MTDTNDIANFLFSFGYCLEILVERVRDAARSERRDRVNDNQQQEDEPDALLQLSRYRCNERFYAVEDEPNDTGEDDRANQQP